MKRLGTPIPLISAKELRLERAGSIPSTLATFKDQTRQFSSLGEGDKLPDFFSEKLGKACVTFQRLFFNEQGLEEIKTEDLSKLTKGLVVVLLQPKNISTCTRQLRNFIQHLPRFKELGVTIAVLTNHDTNDIHELLLVELFQTAWVESHHGLLFSLTLVQDYILAMSDVSLNILANLGIQPVNNALPPIYPCGLYIIKNGLIIKEKIEYDGAQGAITPVDEALSLLSRIQEADDIEAASHRSHNMLTFTHHQWAADMANSTVKSYMQPRSSLCTANDQDVLEMQSQLDARTKARYTLGSKI